MYCDCFKKWFQILWHSSYGKEGSGSPPFESGGLMISLKNVTAEVRS